MELDYTKENMELLLQTAIAAGNKAGDEWMANATPKYEVFDADIITGQIRGPSRGQMLDLCGNAHIKVTDKRSKFYRSLKKFNLVKNEYTATLPIYHKYMHRQEYGLALAIMKAAMEVLTSNGVKGIRIWEYID